MKKMFLTAACCSLIFAFPSCKKDSENSNKPVSKTEMLTTGTWKVTAIQEDDNGDGVFEGELLSTFGACFADNYYTFKANNQFEMNEGPSKCDAIDPQTDVSSWQLTQDEKNLVIGPDSYDIEELSSTTLKLKQVVTGLYGSMVTFTKR